MATPAGKAAPRGVPEKPEPLVRRPSVSEPIVAPGVARKHLVETKPFREAIMDRWIQFLAAYPSWVKVSVVLLLSTAVLLLVVYRERDAEAVTAPDRVAAAPIGSDILLVAAHGQSDWMGLSAWAAGSARPVQVIEQPLDSAALAEIGTRVLILALPRNHFFSDAELKAIPSWVESGGGLFFLGYYAADLHHGSKPNALLRTWGVELRDDVLLPDRIPAEDVRRHVFSADTVYAVSARPAQGAGHELVRNVSRVQLLSAASLDITRILAPPEVVLEAESSTKRWIPEGPRDGRGLMPIIEAWQPDSVGAAPVLVAFRAGRGRVVVSGSWKLLTIDSADNRRLVDNILSWLGGP